jgi:hypothetical protein
MDAEGELVGGTMSNLFVVHRRALVTPPLRFSGVRGVMREVVLPRGAQRNDVPALERPLLAGRDRRRVRVFYLQRRARRGRSCARGELRFNIGPICAAIVAPVLDQGAMRALRIGWSSSRCSLLRCRLAQRPCSSHCARLRRPRLSPS